VCRLRSQSSSCLLTPRSFLEVRQHQLRGAACPGDPESCSVQFRELSLEPDKQALNYSQVVLSGLSTPG
jgi:hypothetical protein